MVALFVILAVAAVAAVAVLLTYNGLVRVRNACTNAWAQIDVQLKRRYDLIPNLVETVKGYAAHERGTFEAVTIARAHAINAGQNGSLPQRAEAENALGGTLKSLFAVAEAYPDLKANQNFLALQEELASTENGVAYARQFFNDAVLRYNNKIQVLPTSLLAGRMHLTAREFFATASAERDPIKVQF